jgi:hypothetical protein
MLTCQYKIEIFTTDKEIATEPVNCNSKLKVREIELIHGEHEALNKTTTLCHTHHYDVFGDMINEESKADHERQNQRVHFKQNVKTAMAMNETITYDLFKENNYGSVQRSIDTWNKIRFHVCRYEYCRNQINKKNIYKILVKSEWTKEVIEKYYFCSYECWHKLVLRIGLERISGKHRIITIDKFINQD